MPTSKILSSKLWGLNMRQVLDRVGRREWVGAGNDRSFNQGHDASSCLFGGRNGLVVNTDTDSRRQTIKGT